jgi:NADPH2:quinone reductase
LILSGAMMLDYFGWPEARRHQTTILEKCADMVSKGVLRVHVSQVLPLRDVAEAHRAIEAGGVTGKIVLQVG